MKAIALPVTAALLLPVLDDFGQDVSVEVDKSGRAPRAPHHMLQVFLIDQRGSVREICSLAYMQPQVMLKRHHHAASRGTRRLA